MSAPRVALIGFTAGACFALGLMAAHVARAAYTITRAGRWYQLKQL